MRTPELAAHSGTVIAASLLLAGAVAAIAPIAPISAAAARSGPAGKAASYAISGDLSGVAATSAGNAWAVGSAGRFTSPKTLILPWNGEAWT